MESFAGSVDTGKLKTQKNFLERLEDWGNIVIMDKEAGDYCITVSPMNINLVRNILDIELGTANYEMKYNPEFVNYSIDFNITEIPSYRKVKLGIEK